MVSEAGNGTWWIEAGALHLDIPRLLKAAGIPDTEENRDLAVRLALQVAREKLPDVTRIVLLYGK